MSFFSSFTRYLGEESFSKLRFVVALVILLVLICAFVYFSLKCFVSGFAFKPLDRRESSPAIKRQKLARSQTIDSEKAKQERPVIARKPTLPTIEETDENEDKQSEESTPSEAPVQSDQLERVESLPSAQHRIDDNCGAPLGSLAFTSLQSAQVNLGARSPGLSSMPSTASP